MTYKTIYTNAGLARIAAAQASGTPLLVTHMAVGDGNGSPVTPVPTQTALAREVYRHAVNRVWNEDAGIPTQFTAELLVPSSVGGFVVREVGVFLADGTMLAVANLPDIWKPETTDGAFGDTCVRTQFVVSNASVITPIIDPAVVIATQMWVLNTINAAVLLPGGTTHQILRKRSNVAGDVEWADPTDVNITVDVVEEYQVLAAGQTTVIMSNCTTQGLSVYVEGVRLERLPGSGDRWQPHSSFPATRITLGRSDFPAGAEIHLVQNEPNTALQLYGVKFWRVAATGSTLTSGQTFVPDNASGACSYLLPATPQDGDSVEWVASSTPFSTYKMNINPNGNTIMGMGGTLDVTSDNFNGRLVWRQALNTWRLHWTGVAGS